MDDFKKNDRGQDYRDFFSSNSNGQSRDGNTDDQKRNEAGSNGSYYYSYGPFKSMNGNPESGGEPDRSEQVYRTEDQDVEIRPPQPLRNYSAPSGGYERQETRNWEYRAPRRAASLKSMFTAFLAGAVVVSGLMFASDKMDLFTGGHYASAPAGNSTKVSTTSDNNGSANNFNNASYPDVVRPNNISQIVNQASPAVVKVENFQNVQAQSNNPFNDPFFQQFFGGGGNGNGGGNNFLDPFGGGSGNKGQQQNNSGSLQEVGLGSGFFFDKSGLILTNYHVIEGAKQVKVVLEGKKDPLVAKVLGTSSDYDLAVLQVPGSNYPYLKLDNSDNISVGSWLVAIGNPYGFDHTVTVGVLSATGRDIPVQDNNQTRQYRHLLQTDASINPGNSGGPLLDLNGNVIGINTAVSEQAQGIGFAIPTSTIIPLLDKLKNDQNVEQPSPFIGVTLRDIQQSWVNQLKLDSTDGALVDQVGYDTPAYHAGLQQYDVITAVNGNKIKNAQDVVDQVGKLKVGEKATFTIVRDGQSKNITITVGDKNKFMKRQNQ